MTKEEIIAVVKECAARLGHAPSVQEFRQTTKISKNQVRRHFGTHTRMLAAAGIERQGVGCPLSTRALFLDWVRVTRSLGKIPTMVDYEQQGKYSVRPLITRYKGWSDVPAGMLAFAKQEGLAGEWEDVLEIIVARLQKAGEEPQTLRKIGGQTYRPRLLANQPIYGQPMYAPFSYAPTNEQGVLFVFGSVAEPLGFSITRIQTGFPDVEAMREVEPNRWQRVRIELEYESRNFVSHMHPVDGCELIVCWIHNWEDCPLEVIELRTVIEDLRRRKG